MKKVLPIISILLFVFSTPIIAQSKKEKQQQEYVKTKELIEGGVYTFVPTIANTQKGRCINLTTFFNSLEINKVHAVADLPFFGFSQVSNFKGDGGIKFDTKNVDYKIDYNDKKHKITIKFKAKNKTETFDLFLTVYSDAIATLNVTGSQRDFMSYSGDIKTASTEK